MTSSWATVVFIAVLAFGFGIAIGRIQVGKQRSEAGKGTQPIINITLGGSSRYSRDDISEVPGQMAKGLGDSPGGGPRGNASTPVGEHSSEGRWFTGGGGGGAGSFQSKDGQGGDL